MDPKAHMLSLSLWLLAIPLASLAQWEPVAPPVYGGWIQELVEGWFC